MTDKKEDIIRDIDEFLAEDSDSKKTLPVDSDTNWVKAAAKLDNKGRKEVSRCLTETLAELDGKNEPGGYGFSSMMFQDLPRQTKKPERSCTGRALGESRMNEVKLIHSDILSNYLSNFVFYLFIYLKNTLDIEGIKVRRCKERQERMLV